MEKPVTPLVPRHQRFQFAWLVQFIGVIFPFTIWEAMVKSGILDGRFLPEPSRIVLRLLELMSSGAIVPHMLASVWAVLLGFFSSVFLGVLVALLVHQSKWLFNLITPVVEMVRSIAPLALWPAFMLILGIGVWSKLAMIIWVSWIPIFINTLQGLQMVEANLIKLTRLYSANALVLWIKVLLPGAFPYIVAGFRLSFGSGFLALVAAEMIGSNSGLGFYILEASQTFRVLDMYAAIFLISCIGVVLNSILVGLEKRFSRWRIT